MANHLAMSDEEFLNQPLPETAEASSVEAPASQETPTPEGEDPNAGKPEGEAETQTETPAAEPDAGTPPAEGEEATPPTGSEGTKSEGEAAPQAEGTKAPDPATAGPTASEAKPEVEAKPEGEPAPVNYEEKYKSLLAPLRANGKDIELKDEAELRQLAAMGANYTRKMQEMAPHRKMLTMLANNGLDEDKLSFLIDLDKKDPEAIKRLIKDSGIDPLDIDTNTEPAYREGSHKVSDQDVAFQTQLDELSSNEAGKVTLQTIAGTWDQASKEKLFDQPDVLPIIHDHREAGIYTKIVDEMDRQKTLGTLPANTPFLDAYHKIGDQLNAAGAFTGLVKSGDGKPAAPAATVVETPAPAAPTPVATRTAAPKPDANAANAAAAAVTRTAPGRAGEVPNFLAMTDEEFAKQTAPFAGRV